MVWAFQSRPSWRGYGSRPGSSWSGVGIRSTASPCSSPRLTATQACRVPEACLAGLTPPAVVRFFTLRDVMLNMRREPCARCARSEQDRGGQQRRRLLGSSNRVALAARTTAPARARLPRMEPEQSHNVSGILFVQFSSAVLDARRRQSEVEFSSAFALQRRRWWALSCSQRR